MEQLAGQTAYRTDNESIVAEQVWRQVALLVGKEDYENEVRTSVADAPDMEDDEFFHWEDRPGLRERLDKRIMLTNNKYVEYALPIMDHRQEWSDTTPDDIKAINRYTRQLAMLIAQTIKDKIGIDYIISDLVIDSRSAKPPFKVPVASPHFVTIFFF